MQQLRPGRVSELCDDLVYIGSNESGKINIPLTGWDIRHIGSCGFDAAVEYAQYADIDKWLSQYPDELVFNGAKQCVDCDFEELHSEGRDAWWGYIIYSIALEMKEYNDPAVFLGTEETQKVWG